MSERGDGLDAASLHAHAAWLRALAHSLARGADAEDLEQETWRIALERAPASLDAGRFRGWLTTVARRLALRGRRDAAAHRAHEERCAIERGAVPESDSGERALLHKRIADAVLELDEPFRSAVVLRYVDGLDARRIAERQGVSHDAARQRLSRALAVLRKRLDRDYGGGRARWAALAWPRSGEGLAAAPWITGGAWLSWKIAILAVALGAAMWWWWDRRGQVAEPASVAIHQAAVTPAAIDDVASTSQDVAFAPAERTPVPVTTTPSSARTIDRERDLHGIVVDGERRPVAGARVSVVEHEFAEIEHLDLDPTLREESRSHVATQTTDAAGEFAIALAPGRSYDLVVEAEGFAPGAASHCHAGERIVIALGAGGTVSGRVVRAADGSPVVGAAVELNYSRELDAKRTADAVRVETDADGRYRFVDLPPGKRLLGVFPLVDATSGWVELALTPGCTIEQDFRVEAGHRLRGRVLDRDTRAPIAGALVGEGWMPRRTVRTDARGEFELPGSTLRGRSQIAVRAKGYGRVDVHVDVPGSDSAGAVEVVLERGRTLRGRVVDRSGAPIEHARVIAAALEIASLDSLQKHDWQTARTRSDGTYEIDDVRRDLHHTLFVKKAGHGVVSYELDDRDDVDVLAIPDVVLDAGAIVRGVLRDEDGEPHVARVVHLRGRNRDASMWNDLDVGLASSALDARSTRTDDVGRFAFADVADGEYELSAPLQNVEDGVRKRVSVDAAARAVEVDLVLPRGHSIAGRVVGPEGEGVHAWLVLEAPTDPRGLVRQATEDDGTFEVRGLAAGVYSGAAYPTHLPSVAASERLASAAIVDVPAGSVDVVVRVDRSAPLRGRVLEADGSAADGVEVEAHRDGFVAASGATGADGTFLLWVAESGRYSLRATKRTRREGAVESVEILAPERAPTASDVAPGERVEHVLRLP